MDWRNIKGLRNVLIHGYAEVDLDCVWTIAQKPHPTARIGGSRARVGRRV
ncbi:MAG: hypothetical protein C7B46_03010 [Sulfobacillus benefaciens]|uniref:DUF86 domain-containing protein n=1 Tax=Sulfobacillus benefaciens TaxID=453960 RepID=A0A2T2XKF6_9FIRM|nr:MAG: hypothetical protein C7B46_03010 [Sulfobacillus benefaciens]